MKKIKNRKKQINTPQDYEWLPSACLSKVVGWTVINYAIKYVSLFHRPTDFFSWAEITHQPHDSLQAMASRFVVQAIHSLRGVKPFG